MILSKANKMGGLVVLLGLASSCGLLPKKDFSSEPLNIRSDSVTQITWISSNWVDYYAGKDNGYISIYVALQNQKGAIRMKTMSVSKNALYYDRIYFLCDKKEPISLTKKPLEDWNKNFEVKTGAYGLSTFESGDVVLSDKIADYVLGCENNLIVRLEGGNGTRSEQFRYVLPRDERVFQGFKDLNEAIKKLKESKKSN